MIRPTYDHGVHLRGTPVWIDAARRRELCLVTALGRALPPLHRRIVASAPAAEILQRAGYRGRVLPAPWGRWIGLGGQKVSFVDAGTGAGAAYILLDSGRERVLATGLLGRYPESLPAADELVVCAPALGHGGASMDEVASELGNFIARAEGEGARAAVLVDRFDVAYAVLKALEERGHALRPLGLLRKGLPARARKVAGAALAVGAVRVGPDTTVAWVDTGCRRVTGGRAGPPTADLVLALGWYCDLAGLRQALATTGARRLWLTGAAAQDVQAATEALGSLVMVRRLGGATQLELAP